MLAVHKMKCRLFWSVKGFSWAYIPCMLVYHFTQPRDQPWNSTTQCKITGQSKTAYPRSHYTEGSYMTFTSLIVHAELFLPTPLPCSRSLLMQIPTRKTLGFILSVQIMKQDVSSCGLMEPARFGLPSVIVPWPASVQRWAQAVHIWSNPPAPLERGSIQGTQPSLPWAVLKQLTSRIMHHFIWLSKQQMDNVIICVSHWRNLVHQHLNSTSETMMTFFFFIWGYECFVACMFFFLFVFCTYIHLPSHVCIFIWSFG